LQVKADGAIDATEVWVEFKSGWEGQEIDIDGEDNTEAYTRASMFNASSWDFDALNITDVRAYIYNGDDDISDRPYRIGVWNYTADNDAGARFGYIEFTQDDTITPEWKGATGQDPIMVTYNVFFLGVWTDNNPNAAQLHYSTSDGSLKSVYSSGFAGDPFSEAGSFSDRTYNIQFRGWGYKNTTTTHNQYYGTATDYVARRDVNYTFPTSASDRQIRFVHSATEGMRNITYSNGGLWDSSIPSSEYTDVVLNATHKVVTLDNTDIGNYGGDLRFYTQSHDYVYNIGDVFYENGTSYGPVNITSNTVSETETVEITGELTYGSSNEVLFFSWSLSGGGTRRLYTPFQSESFKVFFPEDTYATYDFEVKDYTGKHLLGNRYLEAYRSVNTTLELIERMQILTGNSVPLSLVTGKTYVLKFLWGDQTRTTWGYFVPGIDPTPTLIVRGVDFTEQAYTASSFISVEATRPSSTTITIDYDDSRLRTINVSISIRVRNGAVVHTYSSTDDAFTYNWGGAGSSTGYIVAVTGEHQDQSEWGYTKILDQDETFPDPPDLTGIFTFGGFDATTIIAYALTLTALLTASYSYREQGLLFAMAVASFMSYIGWANWSYYLLALGWFFSILVVLLGRRLR